MPTTTRDDPVRALGVIANTPCATRISSTVGYPSLDTFRRKSDARRRRSFPSPASWSLDLQVTAGAPQGSEGEVASTGRQDRRGDRAPEQQPRASDGPVPEGTGPASTMRSRPGRGTGDARGQAEVNLVTAAPRLRNKHGLPTPGTASAVRFRGEHTTTTQRGGRIDGALGTADGLGRGRQHPMTTTPRVASEVRLSHSSGGHTSPGTRESTGGGGEGKVSTGHT